MARSDHTDAQWSFATEFFWRMRSAFSRASRLYFSMLFLRVMGAFLAFLAPLLNAFDPADGPLASIFIGFLLVVTWHIVDYFYRDYRSKGEWARRAGLIINSRNPSQNLLAQLKPRLGTLPVYSRHPDKDGFDTESQFGFKRLTEMIAERAGKSGATYKTCHQQVGFFLVGFGVITLTIFYFVATHHLGSAIFLVGYFGSGSAIIFPEAFRMWIAYGGAARAVSAVYLDRIPFVVATNYDSNATFLLVEDYTSAVESAPMFLPWTVKISQTPAAYTSQSSSSPP